MKFLLYPGEIKSKTDGDIHFISAYQLREAYKINKFEHTIAVNDGINSNVEFDDTWIRLYPRPNGDYEEHLKGVLKSETTN